MANDSESPFLTLRDQSIDDSRLKSRMSQKAVILSS
jgi:hypothetical protein